MKKISLIAFLAFLLLGNTFASGPVTLTSYYQSFNYLPEVQFVIEHGVIDGRIISFLVDENKPIDEKAAIINTLVDHNKTSNNALTYKQFIARKYRQDWQAMEYDKLSADDLFCLGYITLLDDKGNPDNALSLLEMAAQKSPNSYTINLFYALAQAQKSISVGDDCTAWKTCNNVKMNTTLNNDLNPGVASLIYGVMESYNQGCE